MEVSHGGIASGYLTRGQLQALENYCQDTKQSRNKVVQRVVLEMLKAEGYLTGNAEDRKPKEPALEKPSPYGPGRPRALSEEDTADILRMYLTGEHTYRTISEMYGVTPVTIGKYIRKELAKYEE